MRISDADRDRAASILSNALAEGRLTPEEHSQRLDAVFAARTHDDIVPIVRDLPGAGAGLVAPPGSYALDSPADSARLTSVFSGTSRKGVWRVPAQVRAMSVFGDTSLDLRDAVLASREIRIKAYSILGTVEITVPPEMRVIDNGLALLGGREIPPDSPETAGQDGTVLRITGVSLLGTLTVRRQRRQGETHKKDLKRA